MEILLIYVVYGMICAAVGYALAPSRGRDGNLWAAICFFTGIIGLILLYVMPRQPARS